MTSVVTIGQDIEKIIIPLLKEILERIKNLENKTDNTKELVEAGSAKVISEMKKCPCNKEILDALKVISSDNKDKQIIKKDDKDKNLESDEEDKPRKRLFSFPNNSVGFTKLGTGKNKDSMIWPPKLD